MLKPLREFAGFQQTIKENMMKAKNLLGTDHRLMSSENDQWLTTNGSSIMTACQPTQSFVVTSYWTWIGVVTLLQSSYSPNLSSFNLDFFLELKTLLIGTHFEDIASFQLSMTKSLKYKSGSDQSMKILLIALHWHRRR